MNALRALLRRPTILIVILFLALLVLTIHQWAKSKHAEHIHSRNSYDVDINGEVLQLSDSLSVDDLRLRVDDLKMVRASLRSELMSMQREKAKLMHEKYLLIDRNRRLLTQISNSKSQLRQIEVDLGANRKRKLESTCDNQRVAPIIFNPMKLSDIGEQLVQVNRSTVSEIDELHLNINSSPGGLAYDYSRCSLAKRFAYHLHDDSATDTELNQIKLKLDMLIDILRTNSRRTIQERESCISITVITSTKASSTNQDNHICIDLFGMRSSDQNGGCAIASPIFKQGTFRPNLDILLPSVWNEPTQYESLLGAMPPQSPIERKYLACYFGRNGNPIAGSELLQDEAQSGTNRIRLLESILMTMHQNSIDDRFLFLYDCNPNTNAQCYENRDKIIELSSFMIILCHTDTNHAHVSESIHMALLHGSVPVIIGKKNAELPFGEVIDWRRAAIILPTARLNELHFILRTISAADMYSMKRQGRMIFERYLATSKQIIDTTLALISLHRFNYPPEPVDTIQTNKYYNSNERMQFDYDCSQPACQQLSNSTLASVLANDVLGPREKPLASVSYERNYSLALLSSYDLWNSHMYSPLQLHPSNPNDPLVPLEYKFLSRLSHTNFRPIADGLGGSGAEFSRALGGDFRNEQFTMVVLTYDRTELLLKTLNRFKGMAYLNKILVVWNGVRRKPPSDLLWPDVGVPIDVVRVSKNSLNNRFVPYDAIETDAILSIDDDTPLRPDEIVFGFRVWREARDRLVGFPGRYAAWNQDTQSWMYNSNHSCELSMVLTGGAFFHRYYAHRYTFDMPQAIRSMVDNFMNCEDIAMNFLIAHLTRKPPIKVTSRWTFHCADCESSLSEDESHFRERHECLNVFASVYGYMPLMSTQHRSDSVLFKTRLPRDKQKCYRFV